MNEVYYRQKITNITIPSIDYFSRFVRADILGTSNIHKFAVDTGTYRLLFKNMFVAEIYVRFYPLGQLNLWKIER